MPLKQLIDGAREAAHALRGEADLIERLAELVCMVSRLLGLARGELFASEAGRCVA
jgi:hypothetical protein